MKRDIVRDPLFLAQKSAAAAEEDRPVADDLVDTLRENSDRCVGMAANMIGQLRRIIVFDGGNGIEEMFNPEIVSAKDPFETEEGCLSLDGTRKTKRYRKIKVRWQTRTFETRMKTFEGWTAQIIQHEIDHCDGKLI